MNYIFTNRLSIGGWIWRCMSIVGGVLFLIWIATAIGGSIRLSSDRITSYLARPTVQSQLTSISEFLSGDQYITISETGGFVTNKTGIRYSNRGFVVEAVPQESCEEWFMKQDTQGIALTNKSLCTKSNNRQQVLTWAQLLSGLNTSTASSGEFVQYTGLTTLMQDGTINITNATLQEFEDSLIALSKDTQFASTVDTVFNTMLVAMIIPTLLFIVIGAAVSALILLIGLLIYSLVTWAIAGIMKYDISFDQAFSISRLPWTLFKIIGIIAHINWAIKIVVWIVFIAVLIYWRKQEQKPSSSVDDNN